MPARTLPQNFIGRSFGRLTVLADRGFVKGRHFWLCECACGNTKSVSHGNLVDGNTRSCGCLFAEHVKVVNRTHGHAPRKKKSPTYYSWKAMLIRCTSHSHKQWKDYGGRGIQVCVRWRKFSNFLADMGERPIGKSIDRMNNNGNYEPKNCRWATRSEQWHSRRKAA